MATLTVQTPSLTGLDPTLTAASGGGDEFVNDGATVLHVKNGGGGSINVTVDSQTPCSQGFDHDVVVAVPAGAERLIGPFPQARFNDANGKAQVAYSGVTSVTVAARKGS